MQRIKRVCFFCLHKLWLALAISLVLLATLISVLRFTLPYADDYKHHVEQLIADRYGANVQIGQLSAAWQKFGPALVLNNLSLLDEQQQLQMQIEQTRVRFDFWRSLVNWQLTAEHFQLSGLTYYTQSDRLMRTQATDTLADAPILDALEKLFLKQLKYFSVHDSKLVLQHQHNPDLVINIKQLDWSNSGLRHQGFGEIAVDGVTANTVSFILDLYGDDRNKVFGQLYLQSDQLDVLPWFRQVLPPSRKLEHASVNFAAWGRIDNGLLQRLQVQLAENSLTWQYGGNQHRLQLGQGQLLWQPAEDGWSLFSGPLTLVDQRRQWPDLYLQLHRKQHATHQHAQWSGSMQNFQLAALTPLVNLFAEDHALLHHIAAYQPSGYLQQLSWQYSEQKDSEQQNSEQQYAEQQWAAQGIISGLTSVAVGDVPGVSGLAGEFWLAQDFAKLTLSGKNNLLQWDGLFSDATPYQQLEATAYLSHQPDGWQLTVPHLSLSSAELQLDASLQFADSQLQLLARAQQFDAQHVSRYLPQRYLPDTVHDYLQQAIIAGQLTGATMVWHGIPQHFPFGDKDGVFQVLAEVEQAEFAFAPDWPLLQDLRAQLWFENASMHLQSQQGKLVQLALEQGVTVSIANLFEADGLNIYISRQVEAQHVTELMLHSPLRESLGQTLQHLGVSGEISGDVKLDINFNEPVVASGDIRFTDAKLALQSPALNADEIKGELHFVNDKIQADNLQLSWQGLPIQAALQGRYTDTGYQLAMQLNGEHSAQQLAQTLYPDVVHLVNGQTDWQLQLALNAASSGISYQAELRSSLHDTELLLPVPYSKAAASSMPLKATLTGNAVQSQLSVNYADQLFFHAELLHEVPQISRAHLILGPDDLGLQGRNFTISANLPQLALLDWYQLIEQQLNGPKAEGVVMPVLSQVRGKIEQILLPGGIKLNNAVFELNQQPQQWLLQLNASEVASQWVFHKQWQQQGLTAQFDYLRLPQPATDRLSADEDQLAQRWLLQLPPVRISCTDCSVGNFQLGKVTAKASGNGQRWHLSEFNAQYKQHQLQATGSWYDNEELGQSEFSGKLTSPNLGAMLSEFQLTSAIAGSKADIQFAFNWPAAPTQFEMHKLNGLVSYKLNEGSLTEVSDQGARLFSLFSLDSLLRKLRLDFRDVFAKGFFYNGMSGDLTLTNGVAQTSNASVDGVPGNLSIQGYADLVNQQLDYQMTFAPKVTSSLPVIIAWMVNPATGLAALALDEVFQSAEVISKINFTITGTFDEPVVNEVNRHSKQVPVPVRVAQPEPAIIYQPVTQEDPPHG